MSYIEIKNLKKSYGSNVVLKDISIQMEEGTLNTFLGPSGSGKSTLLRCVAGLEKIDSGEIYIDGQRVDHLPPKERNIGMVFQHYALFPNMTAKDNVKFGLEMDGVDKDTQEKEAMRMLEVVGLKDKADSYPRQLSGGQQQRVALARSIVTKPTVLFLDEPLSALDAKIRVQLRNLIKDIQIDLGITVILVTHDQEEAMTMSDEIFVMDSGYVAQEGTPFHIYRHPENNFVADFIGNHNLFQREEYIRFLPNATGSLVAIRPEIISLEPIDQSIADHFKTTVEVIHGIVRRESMLGSVYRLYVEVEGSQIIVDQLNRKINYREPGEDITLYLMRSDIIIVEK